MAFVGVRDDFSGQTINVTFVLITVIIIMLFTRCEYHWYIWDWLVLPQINDEIIDQTQRYWLTTCPSCIYWCNPKKGKGKLGADYWISCHPPFFLITAFSPYLWIILLIASVSVFSCQANATVRCQKHVGLTSTIPLSSSVYEGGTE